MNLCITYLPPEYSSRGVDANEFYEQLLANVYQYQTMGSFIICGDLNSRCSAMDDVIRGVDEIEERHIIDFKEDNHGGLLIDFLISANCCILNGRNMKHNDFTSFNHHGQAVVDYVFDST
jgi:hypothetical protein